MLEGPFSLPVLSLSFRMRSANPPYSPMPGRTPRGACPRGPYGARLQVLGILVVTQRFSFDLILPNLSPSLRQPGFIYRVNTQIHEQLHQVVVGRQLD